LELAAGRFTGVEVPAVFLDQWTTALNRVGGLADGPGLVALDDYTSNNTEALPCEGDGTIDQAVPTQYSMSA
jgi:hypothetical protein